MAFLFVDRITHLERGRAARGYFQIPAGVREWPLFLLAEGVGQLASWPAMADTEFRFRPVAALAGEVLVTGSAAPGDLVDLEVHFQGVERNAVLYGGSASVAGRTLIEMRRCVGPLLPMEDFDDPAAARARFERLCAAGENASYQEVEPPVLEILAQDRASIRAGLTVPSSAAFFAEHFPRRPVYPATLFLDRQIHVAQRMLGGGEWKVRRVSHVKIAAFVFPGERLEVEALAQFGDGTATVALTGFRAGVRVSRARMEFQHRPD